jgi:glutaredoxin
VRTVTLFTADGCSLCARALEVVNEVHGELGFELDVVEIGTDASLESRYRAVIPAIEIDGELVFTYFVDADALRERLTRT